MSNDSLLAWAFCCLSCVDCMEKTDTSFKDEAYKKLPDKEQTKEKDKSVLLYVEYQLSDERMIRNADGFPICGWCKGTIENTKIAVVMCNECKKFMGHPICFKKQKICPFCIKT